ncbi:MAG: rhodanese-like domain-containing protein [Oscillospiraceae bacterium]|nr:rhodanese-like domain-containing protein [Oscillospiraceae bacterium]
MRKQIYALLLALVLLLTACAQAASYEQITQEEAKQIMDTTNGYILLDTRTQEEYDQSHIPGALLIPHTEIAERAEAELPDKDQLILVYCRSGNRSKQASEVLAELGYTNVKEFGGINTWPYEVE